MERRDVIKGVAPTAAILSTQSRLSALSQDQTSTKKSGFALPIRGITKRSGQLLQPIQLTIAHTGTDAMLLVRVDYKEVEHRVLSSGPHTFNVYVYAVEKPQRNKPFDIWRSDLREQRLERIGPVVNVPAWALVILRIEVLET